MHGYSEKIIGNWLSTQGANFRDSLVLSSHICGYDNEINWCRKERGGTKLNKRQIKEAVDDQLLRLRVDYIDILNFQWPDRHLSDSFSFMNAGDFQSDSSRIRSDSTTTVMEQIEVVNELIRAGKIKHFGLCNETPYGGEYLIISNFSLI